MKDSVVESENHCKPQSDCCEIFNPSCHVWHYWPAPMSLTDDTNDICVYISITYIHISLVLDSDVSHKETWSINSCIKSWKLSCYNLLPSFSSLCFLLQFIWLRHKATVTSLVLILVSKHDTRHILILKKHATWTAVEMAGTRVKKRSWHYLSVLKDYQSAVAANTFNLIIF